MTSCPSHSAKGVTCKFPSGHPGPHKGTSESGRTVTWGFRAADRPMYPGTPRRPFSATFRDVPEDVTPKRCQSVYLERGLRFQCVKDGGHPGNLHRFNNVRWSST